MIAFFEDTHNMLPGLTVAVRSVAIQTRDGVIILSPINFTPQQRAQIVAMGKVVAIIEPSLFHSAFAVRAKNWFPTAELWGSPGAPEKHPQIGWNKTLHQDPWPYAPDLQTIFVRGAPKLGESVFYHTATKTLFVTDLVFNMKKTHGLLAPVMFRWLGIYNKFTVGSFMKKMVDDPLLLREALNEILNLDFERVVMAHGEVVTTNAKSMLAGAFRAKGLL